MSLENLCFAGSRDTLLLKVKEQNAGKGLSSGGKGRNGIQPEEISLFLSSVTFCQRLITIGRSIILSGRPQEKLSNPCCLVFFLTYWKFALLKVITLNRYLSKRLAGLWIHRSKVVGPPVGTWKRSIPHLRDSPALKHTERCNFGFAPWFDGQFGQTLLTYFGQASDQMLKTLNARWKCTWRTDRRVTSVFSENLET